MINFEKQIEHYRNLIDNTLDMYCRPPELDEKVIYEAMAYSIKAGGKRIRPILSLAVCDMLGGNIGTAIPFAVAIEMIHTYSLIHDDLPCMDDDDLRRGKPTCHKVFGEAVAVLAGDALLTGAFAFMTHSLDGNNKVSAEDRITLISQIIKAAGVGGMIGGQVLDMMYEGGDRVVSLEQLVDMHSKKTGALISCASEVGAFLAFANEDEILKIRRFAENLGLAFQIKDDILDILGNSITLGKNTGMDIERGKSTFVTVLGLEGAIEMLEQTTKSAIEEISCFGEKAEFLVEFTKYLLERDN